MPLPAVTRPLTFQERRYVAVYRYCMTWQQQSGVGAVGVTMRQLGTLLGLAHDGSSLKKLVDEMVQAGWVVAMRDQTSRFAPTRVRAVWDAELWERHIAGKE